MNSRKAHLHAALLVAVVALSPAVSAAMAVVDAGAIARLAQQIRLMQNQLQAARDQLTQADRAYRSVTGSRGMERLLGDSVRNYLPTDFVELQQTVHQAAGAYGALSADIQAAINGNAVLQAGDLARWSPSQRNLLEEGRRAYAGRQAMTRQALRHTSQRFSALQQLIDAIGTASDPKAVMDLQARIAVEQAMLANEGSKLEMLQQVAQAEEAVRRQRLREQAMADVGSLRGMAPMGLR